jgi:vacuolar-type H+-ATPase subunit E/Vma4
MTLRRRGGSGRNVPPPNQSGLGSRIEKLLRMAEEERDQIIADAHEEAARIVDDAHKQAEQILANAELQAGLIEPQ